MKVLIFIHSLQNGGAERVTANLANYWVDKGWDITVVTFAKRNSDFYTLHPMVQRIALELTNDSSNVWAGLWNNLPRIVALRRVLRQVRPDIALGMITNSSVLLALAALGLPNLCSIGTERNHPPQTPLDFQWKILRSCTYGLLNVVTALTSESAEWIKHNTNARRIVVIPNAVFLPLPIEEPRIIPSVICRSGRKIVLAAGRLNAQKGHDWLIKAFSNLSQKHSDWDLVILGEGSLRTTIERQVQKAGLEKRIFIPGRAGNISEWYETADLYVMSSRFEGFPNSLLEAMAHGLPVVSFDCDTGPRDIVRHEVDGLLVPSGDVGALTASIDRLMSDPLERQRFAMKAVEVRERFSLKKILGMWEQLFAEICK